MAKSAEQKKLEAAAAAKSAAEKAEAEKAAGQQSQEPAKENQGNILDSFINSDNTDIDKEKNEAEINDDLDWGEEKPAKESIPDELKDVPRKYWKHQTV